MQKLLVSGMYFAYEHHARSEVKSPTTFAAVLSGERTATTRLSIWPQFSLWCAVRMGDVIRFFEDREMRGEYVDCVATCDAVPIDLSTLSREALEEWSRLEGWRPYVAGKLARSGGSAVQVRFRLCDMYDNPPLLDL